MSRRLLPVVLGALLVFAAAGSAGASSAPASGASARAYAIKVAVPGQPVSTTGAVSAPGNQVTFGGGYAYPAEAPVVQSGAFTGSATTSTGDAEAVGNAAAEVNSLSLFGGEITATQVLVRAQAAANAGEGSGDLSASKITGLVVLGQPVEAAPGQQVALADWGYLIVLGQGAAPGRNGYRNFVTGLEVHLNADHGGLPAGTTIFVGYAEAAASAAPPPPPPTTTAAETAPKAGPKPKRAPKAKPAAEPSQGPIVRRVPPDIEVKLTRGGYVFPVHGPASFTNTFGAPRAVVGWHHGEDIFAPMGAPVLAVARGAVFSVGWNDIGGNRLWLRDEDGNEFYYAHLSAFSPLAVDGTQVEAGDVLGFVGNSGDAQTTPPHLHFEFHPVGMLGLGYDGVVDPNPFLLAWERLEDIRLVPGATWTPPVAPQSRAPRPGAFLLSSTDISTARGAQPGGLTRALAAAPTSAEQAQPAGD